MDYENIKGLVPKLIIGIVTILIIVSLAIGIYSVIKRFRKDDISVDLVEIEKKYLATQDSLKSINTLLMAKADSAMALADAQQKRADNNQIKTIQVETKRNETLRILNNNTPTELDNYMGTIYIKTTGN